MELCTYTICIMFDYIYRYKWYTLRTKPYPKYRWGLERQHALACQCCSYLIFKSRVVGDMVGHSLLYIHIWNSGRTCALRKSTQDMVLRNTEIKASKKECKMKNLVTTWAGTFDRGKTKACHGSADPRSALFTYNKRSGPRCRSMELPPACEKIYNKMIRIEVNVYL